MCIRFLQTRRRSHDRPRTRVRSRGAFDLDAESIARGAAAASGPERGPNRRTCRSPAGTCGPRSVRRAVVLRPVAPPRSLAQREIAIIFFLSVVVVIVVVTYVVQLPQPLYDVVARRRHAARLRPAGDKCRAFAGRRATLCYSHFHECPARLLLARFPSVVNKYSTFTHRTQATYVSLL